MGIRDRIEVRSLINWFRLFFKKGYWDEKWLLRYGWEWIKPNKKAIGKNSGIFDLGEISGLKDEVVKMGREYPLWWPRIFEPETKGIRTWEYGKLLAGVDDWKNKKVLDVGTGGSKLPNYLAKLGARVISLDRDKPLEKTDKDKAIKFVLGSMTKIPSNNNVFDYVVCVSALEHLDMKKGYEKTYGKNQYYQRAIASVKEMKRVVKKNGWIFLTTDFFLPEQKTDNWPLSNRAIRGAFEWNMIGKIANILDVSWDNFEKLLRNDSGRANYRGRFFTTVCFWWQKTT